MYLLTIVCKNVGLIFFLIFCFSNIENRNISCMMCILGGCTSFLCNLVSCLQVLYCHLSQHLRKGNKIHCEIKKIIAFHTRWKFKKRPHFRLLKRKYQHGIAFSSGDVVTKNECSICWHKSWFIFCVFHLRFIENSFLQP